MMMMDFVGAKGVMEVVTATGPINSRAKLQSNHHHQQTNNRLFTGRMPFLSPNQQCQSMEENVVLICLTERNDKVSKEHLPEVESFSLP